MCVLGWGGGGCREVCVSGGGGVPQDKHQHGPLPVVGAPHLLPGHTVPQMAVSASAWCLWDRGGIPDVTGSVVL